MNDFNKKIRLFFSIIAIFIISWFGGCYPSAYTQTASNDRGIGGTGIVTDIDIDERGIGGTGIIGTITAFGSIVVNGLHIEYREDQVVDSLFEQKLGRNLKIGQVVEVFAKNEGNNLIAESISERIALTGKITSIDTNSQTITLNNLEVALPQIDAIQDALEVGLDVTISGHWLNGTLYSSYIENVSGKYGEFDEPIIGSALIDLRDIGLGKPILTPGNEALPPETYVYSKVEGVDRNLVITDHIKSFPREGNLIFQEKIKKDKDKTSSSDLLNRYVIVSQKGVNKEIKLGHVLENGDAMSIKELKEIAKQHSLNNRPKNSNKSLPDLKPGRRDISNNDLKTSNRSNSGGETAAETAVAETAVVETAAAESAVAETAVAETAVAERIRNNEI